MKKNLSSLALATFTEVEEAQFDHDIAAFKSEINALESEASPNSGVAKTKLQAKLAAAKASFASAVHRAQQRVDALKDEADAKTEAFKLQLSLAKADVKDRIEDRMERVKSAHHVRSAKLS